MTTCPKCGSRFLRPSQTRDFSERIARLRFVAPFRCQDCKTRFVGKTLVWSDFLFARCPKCRRMDLNAWTGKSYEPPFWMSVKIVFGGWRWRCEYCRLNFASFRNRKEIFSFSRWRKLGFGPPLPGESTQPNPSGPGDEVLAQDAQSTEPD